MRERDGETERNIRPCWDMIWWRCGSCRPKVSFWKGLDLRLRNTLGLFAHLID